MQPQINERTVAALLDEVRDLLEAEDKRSQSLISRGSGLAAFVGIIVSLAGVVGRTQTSGLAQCVRIALATLLVAAISFLLLAVAAVIGKVLLPSPGKTVAMDEVKRYPTWAYITEDSVMALGRQLRGRIAALELERDRNDGKARWLKAGYVLLGTGLLCIGSASVILGVERLL